MNMKARLAAIAVVLGACGRSPVTPEARVARLDVQPSTVAVLPGDTVRLTATAFDADDSPMTGVQVSWTTTGSIPIVIDSAGLVFAVGQGSGEATASVDGVNASVQVVVQAAPEAWRSVDANCAVWRDGVSYCWRVSQNTIDPPVPVGGPDFAFVRTGVLHGCGLQESGHAYCWGENEYGQLGDGTTQDRFSPVRVDSEQLFDSIAVGVLHTCALARGGDAYCWGGGARGQLGSGELSEVCSGLPCSRTPRKVHGGNTFRAIGAGGVDRIGSGSLGRGLSCGLLVSGDVMCWGYNVFGGVGDGSRTDRDVPTLVRGVAGAVGLAVGATHACALLPAGDIRCWGSNDSGQLGFDTRGEPFHCPVSDVVIACSLEPIQVESDERFRSISAGPNNTCGINAWGAAWCWGGNGFRRVGQRQDGERGIYCSNARRRRQDVHRDPNESLLKLRSDARSSNRMLG